MSRKRRSNRLSAEEAQQLADLRSEARERLLNTMVAIVCFGQESLEWNKAVQRSVALRVALRMVADGDAEKFEVDDPDQGRLLVFRELKPVVAQGETSPAALTMASMEAMAETGGRKLSGRERREVEKVLMWPSVGDTKAPCVRARASVADKAEAAALVSRAFGGNRRRSEIQVAHYALPAAA